MILLDAEFLWFVSFRGYRNGSLGHQIWIIVCVENDKLIVAALFNWRVLKGGFNNGFPIEFCSSKIGTSVNFWSHFGGVYESVCGSPLCLHCNRPSSWGESVDEWVDHGPFDCEFFIFHCQYPPSWRILWSSPSSSRLRDAFCFLVSFRERDAFVF